MANKKKSPKEGGATLASNRAAGHEYHLLRRLEAGIVLTGPEVKSARLGRVNLKESYARILRGEVWLLGAHFSPYEHARLEEAEPVRRRKLLLHGAEIRKLVKEVEQNGMTIVPTRLYLKNGRIKLEIAVAKGKKLYDKRETKKKQDMKREADRAVSERYR